MTDRLLTESQISGRQCLPLSGSTEKSHSTCQRNVIHLPHLQGFKSAPTMDTLCLGVTKGERFPLPSSVLLWSTATLIPNNFPKAPEQIPQAHWQCYYDPRVLKWFHSLKKNTGVIKNRHFSQYMDKNITVPPALPVLLVYNTKFKSESMCWWTVMDSHPPCWFS